MKLESSQKYKHNIGSYIKNYRRKKCFTQKQLAVKIGVTEKTINRWENNQRQPEADNIIDMCKELDISADKILGVERSNEYDEKESKRD